MNKTRGHHFTPKAKEQSKQWSERGESTAKKDNAVPSTGKVMTLDFWEARGII